MAPYFKEKGTIKTLSNLVLNELFGNKSKFFRSNAIKRVRTLAWEIFLLLFFISYNDDTTNRSTSLTIGREGNMVQRSYSTNK